MTEPVLGVLGGMGPAATSDFLRRLAELTPAQRDQDHVPTIVYSDPQTPDRSDAILGTGPSPLPALLRGIEFLNRAGCALIAIPCNTAHYWYDELAASSDAPVLNIVDATASALRATTTADVVGLIATNGTVASGVYREGLDGAGISVRDLTDLNSDNPVMRGIRDMKAGRQEHAREALITGSQRLVDRGAQALVVACTDASAALAGVMAVDGTPILDASTCLAGAAIAKLGPRG